MSNFSLDTINSFLHYGYLPEAVPLPDSLNQWLKNKESEQKKIEQVDFHKLKVKASKILKQCFKPPVNTNGTNRRHVVPLSGGVDSRAVLLGLLEHVGSSEIVAVTFGKPGSYDYETAKKITDKLAVEWVTIDLTPGCWIWKTSVLADTALLSVRPTWLFDNAVKYSIQKKLGHECIYWTGFMGDSLGRLQQNSEVSLSWSEAKRLFAAKNKTAKSLTITRTDYCPESALPAYPYTHHENIDYYSQLNYFVRQQCLTRHIYSPIGYDIHHPFLNPEWIQFILDVPSTYRINQHLYLSALEYAWPEYFQNRKLVTRDSPRWKRIWYSDKKDLLLLASKKLFPMIGRRMGPLRNVNYIDFNFSLRNQNDFKETVLENLEDLSTRQLIDWININQLWLLHQNYKADLAEELMTLAALEIHLKTGTITTV